LSVTGEISGAIIRPTTALPDHIKGGTISSKAAMGVMRRVMAQL